MSKKKEAPRGSVEILSKENLEPNENESEFSFDEIKSKFEQIEKRYSEAVKDARGELEGVQRKINEISGTNFFDHAEKIFKTFEKDVYLVFSAAISKSIVELEKQRESVLRNIHENSDDDSGLSELRKLSSQMNVSLNFLHKERENVENSFLSMEEAFKENSKNYFDLPGVENISSDNNKTNKLDLENNENIKDNFKDAESEQDLCDELKSRGEWMDKKGKPHDSEKLIGIVKEIISGKKKRVPSVFGLSDAARRIFKNKTVPNKTKEPEEKITENSNYMKEIEDSADEAEYKALERDSTREVELIENLRREIDGYNNDFQEGKIMDKYGKDYHFDREKAVIAIENKIKEAEDKIRELEKNFKANIPVNDDESKEDSEKQVESNKDNVELIIEDSDTFDELNNAIINNDLSIKGSKDNFTSAMLLDVISKIRRGDLSIGSATRSGGFRDKIIKLMNKESIDDVYNISPSIDDLPVKPEGEISVDSSVDDLAINELVEPEQKKEDVKLGKELVDVLDLDFGIRIEELESIEGFGDLSVGQQTLIIENIKQLALSKIEKESLSKFNEEQTGSGFLKRVWREMTKNIRIKEREKDNLEEMKNEGLDFHINDIRQLVDGFKNNGPQVEIINGEIQINYAEVLDDYTEEEKSIVNSFNTVATEFAQTPDKWLYNRKKVGEYEEVRLRYEEVKARMLSLLESKKGRKEAMLEFGDMDNQLRMNQFLNSNPDVENVLKGIENDKWYKQIAKELLTERGVYLAGGYLGRAAIKGTMGIAAAPIVASVIGGIRAYGRGKDSLEDRDMLAREGVADESKEARNIASSESLTDKMNVMLREFNSLENAGKENTEESLQILEKLKRRVDYTERKIDDSMVSYGESDDKISNMYALMDSIKEAKLSIQMKDEAVLDMVYEEISPVIEKLLRDKEKAERRLGRELANKEEAIDQIRRSYVIKQTVKGATIGASFALAGVLVREYFSGDEVTTEIDEKGSDKINDPANKAMLTSGGDGVNADTPNAFNEDNFPLEPKETPVKYAGADRVSMSKDVLDVETPPHTGVRVDSPAGRGFIDNAHNHTETSENIAKADNTGWNTESEEKSVNRAPGVYEDDTISDKDKNIGENDIDNNNPDDATLEPEPIESISKEALERATIGKGEGIEHALKRQLMENPKTFGFEGDLGDESKIKSWAGAEAHRTAIKAGYVDPKTGQEVRIASSGVGKAAYVLDVDGQGNIYVHEMYKDNLTFNSQEGHYTTNNNEFEARNENNLEKYEYRYSAPEKEAIINSHPDQGVKLEQREQGKLIDEASNEADSQEYEAGKESGFSEEFIKENKGYVHNIQNYERKMEILKLIENVKNGNKVPISHNDMESILPGFRNTGDIFDEIKMQVKNDEINLYIDGRYLGDTKIIINKNGTITHDKYFLDSANKSFKMNKEGGKNILISILESSIIEDNNFEDTEAGDFSSSLFRGDEKHNAKIEEALNRIRGEQSSSLNTDLKAGFSQDSQDSVDVQADKSEVQESKPSTYYEVKSETLAGGFSYELSDEVRDILKNRGIELIDGEMKVGDYTMSFFDNTNDSGVTEKISITKEGEDLLVKAIDNDGSIDSLLIKPDNEVMPIKGINSDTDENLSEIPSSGNEIEMSDKISNLGFSESDKGNIVNAISDNKPEFFTGFNKGEIINGLENIKNNKLVIDYPDNYRIKNIEIDYSKKTVTFNLPNNRSPEVINWSLFKDVESLDDLRTKIKDRISLKLSL